MDEINLNNVVWDESPSTQDTIDASQVKWDDDKEDKVPTSAEEVVAMSQVPSLYDEFTSATTDFVSNIIKNVVGETAVTEHLDKQSEAMHDDNVVSDVMKTVGEVSPYMIGGLTLPAAAGRTAFAGITADKDEQPLINITGDPRIDSMLTNAAFEGVFGLGAKGVGKVVDKVGKPFKRNPDDFVKVANENIDEAIGAGVTDFSEYGDDFAITAADELANRGGVVSPENLNFDTSGENIAKRTKMVKKAAIGDTLSQLNDAYGFPIAGKLTKYGQAGKEAKNAKIFNEMYSELIEEAKTIGASKKDLEKLKGIVNDYAITGKTDKVDEAFLNNLGLAPDVFKLKKVRQVGGISPEMINKVSQPASVRIVNAVSDNSVGNALTVMAGIGTGGMTTIGQGVVEAASQIARRSLSKSVINNLRGDPELVEIIKDGIYKAKDFGVEVPMRGAIKQILDIGEDKPEEIDLSSVKWDEPTQPVVPSQPEMPKIQLDASNPKKYVNSTRAGAEAAAKDFEQRYGVSIDPSFYQAQSSMETGWGKHVIEGSNNMFNIKADKRWLEEHPGQFVEVKTREEDKDGNSYWVKDKFRKYDSVAESFADYNKFLGENPRYAEAIANASDPVRFADELQKAGYATDTRYKDKLVNQYRSIERRLA